MSTKSISEEASVPTHYETLGHTEDSKSSTQTDLKTRDGIILIPQPSDDPNDPLNWSSLRKHAALATVAYCALWSFAAISFLVPSTLALADEFNVTVDTAVYLGSTPVVLWGVAPLVWNPLSGLVGRRITLLMSNVVFLVGCIVSATAKTYGACMAGRVILGAGGSSFWSLGPACVDEMFFRHEKGAKIGVTSLAIMLSNFIGNIIGGSIASNPKLGWRASQWIPIILMGAGFIAQVLFLPETLYVRSTSGTSSSSGESQSGTEPDLWARYGVRIPKRHRDTKLSFHIAMLRPFLMVRFPALMLMSFWFGVVFMMQVAITAAIPIVMPPRFGFTVLDVGFASFGPLVANLVGEVWSSFSIGYLTRRALRQDKEYQPEVILQGIWPALVMAPGGLIMFGTSIQFPRAWIIPVIGWGVYCFGVEVSMTVVQTYLLECYPAQRSEASLIFNLFRCVMTWVSGFFFLPMIKRLGASSPYCLFAALIVFLFPFTVGILMWRGKWIRDKSGTPKWGSS